MPEIIRKKTSDLVAGIEDPEERRKASRNWSGYLKRIYQGKVEKPRFIHEVARDGRHYVVYFRVEGADQKRKRKTVMDLTLESNHEPL